MHDPMTVAFEIKFPWRKYPKGDKMFPNGYREPMIVIWHVDPEIDGTDSSCMHRLDYRKLNHYEKRLRQLIHNGETIFDNRPHYPDSREHLWFSRLKAAEWDWRKRRTWGIPWRWHVWHWKLQIPALQLIYRWLFKRCSKCGGRFDFNESVVGNWEGNAIWHHRCDDADKQPAR